MSRRRAQRPRASVVAEAPLGRGARLGVPLGVAVWALVVHIAYLLGDPLFAEPVSGFFFADGAHFVARAHHLAVGTSLDASLPFHPPLVSWLLTPLWQILHDPATVHRAAKLLMAVLNAATYAGIYVLLRGRVAWAGLICATMPLMFGEMLLSASPNSEVVYRFLLVVLLLLGRRWPVVGGAVHAAAVLVRVEHLAVAGLLALWGLASRPRRRATTIAVIAGLVCLLPHAVATSASLRAYNAEHADSLPEPLPVLVPVSFYGPLNFALAQREEDIFFSRRTLPVSQGHDAALDPSHPVHNEAIVHGYRLGLRAIFDDPARFVRRSARKVFFSRHAWTYGWTWRDLPKGNEWTRPPVDMAYATAPWWYEILVFALIAAGLVHLRRHPWVLGIGLALVAYRLAINIVFFPYLRSMMIASPFVLLALLTGVAVVARSRARLVLATLLVVLGAFHLATAWQQRTLLNAGERDASGTIIEDRTVRLRLGGG